MAAGSSSSRSRHRKLSDYCSIFAEKTNRIGRNVESFMQSRGFFTSRRSTDESSRGSQATTTTPRSNGDLIRSDQHRRVNRINQDGLRCTANNHCEPPASGRASDRERLAYPRNVYPREQSGNANHVGRSTKPQRGTNRRLDYPLDCVDRDPWRDVTREWNVSKPIMRNGISHGGGIERPHSSTLPRRSKTINFRDQGNYYSLESRRGYPKSLQDLTDLELDDRIREATVSPFLSPGNCRSWRVDRLGDGYRRRRDLEDELLEDDYLRFCRNLSRIERYPQGGKYEPGQVHYERECRTFGKDTVAFIYYKTCYL